LDARETDNLNYRPAKLAFQGSFTTTDVAAAARNM
jgi:hypothetical protein